MRTGSSTGTFRRAADAPHPLEEKEIVRRLHEAGFEALDLNMAPISEPQFFLCQEDWQQRVDEIANEAAKCGIVFSQVHLPFVLWGFRELDPAFREPGYAEHYAECTRRAYIAAGMIGAPWAVAHCENRPHPCYDRDLSAKGNRMFYDPFVEQGIGLGVGTAFENMIQTPGPMKLHYTAHYDELIEFADSYGDPMVKICWDFGHANLTGLDQCAALRKVGKRLACLHVNDNYGLSDNHTIPFLGTVNWLEVIPVLAEIGYEGDCSLEIGISTKNAPAAMQDTLARTACEACRVFRRIYEKAKAERNGR